ncbi:autotransporter domain-containing protein [Bradyrhizobium diazoefficiens]|nr:autotransporter domain-containing protein [Bradyrhizobium diazoefficiens]
MSTTGPGIAVKNVTSFSGGIANGGSIRAKTGIFVSDVAAFAGGIVNNGSITGESFFGSTVIIVPITAKTGISVRDVAAFAGGIANNGTIAGATDFGIAVRNVTSFSGGITNGGTITAKTGISVSGVAAFAGGIANSGGIASTTGLGITVTNVASFSGGITNGGAITAKTGILVNGGAAFAGGVVNNGSIAGTTGFGIAVKNVAVFSDGVVNNGSIASTTGFGIAVTNVTSFSGGIANGGTITAKGGIFVGDGVNFAGPIVNTGNITGLGGTAIDVSTAPNAVTINQSAGTITGKIKLSQFADVLNIYGGAIAGDVFGQGLSNTVNFAPGAGHAFTYANAITGVNAVNVNSGMLLLQGTIDPATLTTVNAGAKLAGTGTVGELAVMSGASFAPGSGTPGSSMNVSGSLALQSGAQYVVYLNPATSSFANVTGTATLGGARVNATFAGGRYVEKQYTILTAGNVSGTFDPAIANSNLPAGFKTSLSYDATHAYLDLALSFIPPSGGFSTNQQNTANAIVNFFNTNGGIPLVFGGLTPAGLTQLSGESATGSQQTTFGAMNQFMGVMTDPFLAGRGGPVGGSGTAYADETLAYAAKRKTDAFALVTKAPAPTPFEQRWNVWAAGFGGTQRTDGSAVLGSNDTRSSIAGVAVGADYRVSSNTLAGFALAGGGTSFNVNGSGSGRSDLFQAGAFVRHTAGPAYLTGALAYGWQDVTTDRIVTVAGLDHLRAEFNANAWSGRVEGGYRLVAPVAGGVGVTPYAAGQFVTFNLPAYVEQAVAGSNQFALGYAGKSVTDARSELGIRTDKSLAAQNRIVTLRGRLAWAHDYNPDSNLLATFQTLPGASFVVNGARHAANSALTTASAEWKGINGWSASATFEGEFSNVTSSYAGKGVLRYTW